MSFPGRRFTASSKSPARARVVGRKSNDFFYMPVGVVPTHSIIRERNRNIVKEQRGTEKRLAFMRHERGYDIREHEAYDVAISALFIVFMLVVIALVFVQ